jgi:hypothetical protein
MLKLFKRFLNKWRSNPPVTDSSDTLVTSEEKPVLRSADFRPLDADITPEVSYRLIYPKKIPTDWNTGLDSLIPFNPYLEPEKLDSYPTEGMHLLPGEIDFGFGKIKRCYAVYYGPAKQVIDILLFFDGEYGISAFRNVDAIEAKGIHIDGEEVVYNLYLDDHEVTESEILSQIYSFSDIEENYINIKDIYRATDSSIEVTAKTDVDCLQFEKSINGNLKNNTDGMYLTPSIGLFSNGSILLCIGTVSKLEGNCLEPDPALLTKLGPHYIDELVDGNFVKKDLLPVAYYSPAMITPGETDTFEANIFTSNRVLSNEISRKMFKIDNKISYKIWSNQLLLPLDLSVRYFEKVNNFSNPDRERQIVQQNDSISNDAFSKDIMFHRLARIRLNNGMLFWGILLYHPCGEIYDVLLIKYNGTVSSIIYQGLTISGTELKANDIYPLNVETAFAMRNGNSFRLEFERWREIKNSDLKEYLNETLDLMDKAKLEGKESKTWKY